MLALALTLSLGTQISVISNKPARSIPVTPEHLATAFRDSAANALFHRARTARLGQDSSLRNYDATVRERTAIGVTVGENGRERVLYRTETASRVRWQWNVGARVELDGVRAALPVVNARTERNALIDRLADGDFGTVPYFPGQESLWLGHAVGSNQINDRSVVNPLAEGAEAYYMYESGDSLSYTLPDGATVNLRELKVIPRTAAWNVAVGSLHLDIASGQVVAAIYRMSAPQDLWASVRDAIDDTARAQRRGLAIAKAFLPSAGSEMSEIIIEYSLHEGRYWLPRTRTWRGSAHIGPATTPATMQQAFTYTRVNGPDVLPPITVDTTGAPSRTVPDSLKGLAARKWRDSVAALRQALQDARRAAITTQPCDSTGKRMQARFDSTAKLAIATTFPCDIDKLGQSPGLSKSLFAADEETFTNRNLEALADNVLGLRAQAALRLSGASHPSWRYGLSMSRYNRVEGFSTGIGRTQQFGGGYVGDASVRLGFADLEPNGELSLARTNLTRTLTLAGYNRLVSAGDWGNPLSFGASVSAFLFGRDEGFYYRASGAELRFKSETGLKLGWRVFAEQHRNARQNTDFSLGAAFAPNIVVTKGRSAGAAVRLSHSAGADPRGFRAFTDVRLEAAGGDAAYGRSAIDITLSQGLFAHLAAALTLAGGSSAGALPPQRRWYLGGTQTIRGQHPDTAQSGNAFWMARAELGRDFSVLRPSLFADVGWAGDRTKFGDMGRPLSGVGVGLSALDGLVRLDLAKGIFPAKEFRLGLSIGARW